MANLFENKAQTDEEIIPPAPQFCKRIDPTSLQTESQKATKQGLELLYHDVVNKLEEERKAKGEAKEKMAYDRAVNESRLLNMVEEFFQCDEERQKAKFMNYLLENNRKQEKMVTLEDHINNLEMLTSELKENEEHMNEIMEGYEEAEKEMKKRINDLETEIFENNEKIIKLQSQLLSKNESNVKYIQIINLRNREVQKWKRYFYLSVFLSTSVFVAFYWKH